MHAGAEARGQIYRGGLALEESYELCRKIEQAHSRTYYFSTQLFAPEVRPHVHALYAFMRYADEIVDSPGALPPEEQLAALDRFEAQTVRAISGEGVLNPILQAFAATVRSRGIRLEDITAFMKSMKMDTRVFRYPTFGDLEVYTHGSAAVVGYMMCRVAGVRDDRAMEPAGALGVAMQLSNFLRDIAEDWRRGRVYVPLEDMERFGYAEEDLAGGVVDERFRDLMRFEIERARGLYERADEGMRYIPRGRRLPIIVARRLYAEILDRIEAQDYDVFSRRAETTKLRKVLVAASCALREPGELFARGGRPSRVAMTPLP